MKELSLQNSRLERRYDVRKLLGRGSYAEIYLAEDNLAGPDSPHRKVVIKALNVFMHDDLDQDLERTLVENFQNEALALDRVRHPNIISRLGHGTSRDMNGVMFHYLVLEYLPGGDLAKFARNHGVSFRQAMRFLEMTSSGLGHAHKHDVIHRDIKPQNLLLTADHEIVKIADFGVARMPGSDGPITRVGTNLYAAPEHSPMFAGSTGQLRFSGLTPAADVYSLAKTAYVLFTGESPRPFANRQIMELPVRVRNEKWASPLLDLLKRSTDNDPGNRPATVIAFWEELSLIGSSVAATETSGDAIAAPSAAPQPAFSTGYNPVAPVRPRFESSKELKFPAALKEKRPGTGLSLLEGISEDGSSTGLPVGGEPRQAVAEQDPGLLFETVLEKRRPFQRFAVVAVMMFAFAAGIYATYNYVLSRASFESITSMFRWREATALMNINLRSDASTANPRIGLVPKGSRLKIIGSKGHWYQVEIIRYGAPKGDPSFLDRGWISGKTRRGDATISIEGEQ